MFDVPPTLILRHRKENLRKCSLRGLEGRPDFRFFTYPTQAPPDLNNYIVLAMDAPVLTATDQTKGLFLLDATWRYAAQMRKQLPPNLTFRSLPSLFCTAYPRRQEAWVHPQQGLASIEALYLAYHILGRDTAGLLDNYHWAAQFLEINQAHLCI